MDATSTDQGCGEGIVETLRSLFPTAEQLLAVSPEDLAPVLLRLARNHLQPAGFWPNSILNEGSITGEPDSGYPHYKKAQVGALLNEAWECLRRDENHGVLAGDEWAQRLDVAHQGR